MTELLSLDRALFVLVNQVWTSAALDAVVPALTDLNRQPAFWAVLATLAVAYLWRRRARAARALAAAALAVACSDAAAARVLKPRIARSRPSAELAGTILRVAPPGSWSFPSNHAANLAAAASAGALCDPPLAPVLVPAALLVAYSRVYVGVHYPLDVLGGALLGALLGWGVAKTVVKERP